MKKNLVNLKTLTERAATSFTYAAAAFVIIFQLINYIIQDLVEIKIEKKKFKVYLNRIKLWITLNMLSLGELISSQKVSAID